MPAEERIGSIGTIRENAQASVPVTAPFKAQGRPNKCYVVREQYLSDEESGLASAIRDSLKSLFAEPRLPDNPYYYLANVLGAYVDRTALWKETDAALVSAIDMEGGVEVGDGTLKLCRLAAFSQAWGLPHVLRMVSKEGVCVLHDLLTNSLPDSFFPGPMPSATGDGYAVQVLASIQGTCALWRPTWLEFPELDVRADVLVKGQRVEEAIGHFLALVESDMKELDGVPVYFVEGLVITESNGGKLEQGGPRVQSSSSPASHSWTLEDMAAQPEDWRKAGMRAVLSGKVLTCRAIILLEAPDDAKHHDKRRLRFEMAIKTYHFHFQSTPDSTLPMNTRTLVAEPVAHYGCGAPHEALYEGYFLEPSAAKQYCLMFSGPGARANAAAAREPYGRQSLEANMEQLMSLIELDMVSGDDLEAFRRLLHLVMLQDPLPLQPGVLHQGLLLPLEELLVSHSQMNEKDMMLSALPNLCRVLNSGAAAITGVVREVEALTVAFTKWPDKQAKILAAAASASAAGTSASDIEAQRLLHLPSIRAARGELVSTPPGLLLEVGSPQGRRGSYGAERRGSKAGDGNTGHLDGTEAVYDNEMNSPRSTLRWLLNFNMEERLLQQLLQLGPRISDATGAGIFSGISTILARMVQYLPTSLPHGRADCAQLMGAVLPQLEALQPLLQAAGLTLADGLLDRCRDVLWTLHRFDISVMESAMARVGAGGGDGSGGATEDEWVVPEWVLSVQNVTDAQVRAGEVAERVAVEGVMLQYCVDSKLDELLAAVWQQLTEPPLSANPFPRLLTFLRARAAKLELWKEDMDETFEHMVTSLSLLQPPMFIYSAMPPGDGSPRRSTRIGRGRPSASQGEDEEGVQVFGSYAAVSLADCRALQSLRASLGTMLADHHWQEGAYSVEVVPALIGDAPLTAALKLDDLDDALVHTKGRHEAGSSARPPFEHPRFFWVECEDHHLVTGPRKREAAALFATGIVKQAVSLQKTSMHLLMHLEVGVLPEGQDHGADVHIYGSHVFAAEDESHQDIVERLVDVVKTSEEGVSVGRLQVLVAVKEGWYVRMTKHLVFQHNDVAAPLRTDGPAATAHRSGTSTHGPAGADSSAEPYWGRPVYRRVFLLEAHAQIWLAWNRARGDPAQPYHYNHMIHQAAKEIEVLEGSGDYFAAQRLLLLSALACQDAEALFHFSHALHSAAQELWCLQVINRTLVELLSDTNPPEHFAKLDNERARRLFLVYNTRMRRALMSPKYCYFSGFAAAAPQVLAELKDAVLTSFRLDAAQTRLMERLNLWTQCCEFSVAASIHDCFDHQLKQRVMGSTPMGSSLHGAE